VRATLALGRESLGNSRSRDCFGGVLAIDTTLGALTGAGAPLIAIGFLGALTFVLFVAALAAPYRPVAAARKTLT
jgi:hypothetical protein